MPAQWYISLPEIDLTVHFVGSNLEKFRNT